MNKCPVCNAPAYEECEADCPNWEIRYDEIWDFAKEFGGDNEIVDEEYVEVDWK